MSTLIEKYKKDLLYAWQDYEYQVMERDRKWYLYAGSILLAIIAYAVYSNSPVVAITFILLGITGYLVLNKPPRFLDFAIFYRGVIVGKEIYEFENIESFWIFYEPEETGMKVLSLHISGALLPFVHLPIGKEDPVKIREALIKFIPEVKQDVGLVETVERLLGI